MKPEDFNVPLSIKVRVVDSEMYPAAFEHQEKHNVPYYNVISVEWLEEDGDIAIQAPSSYPTLSENLVHYRYLERYDEPAPENTNELAWMGRDEPVTEDVEKDSFLPIQQAITAATELLKWKNAHYGNTWQESTGIASKASALDKLLVRLDDKLGRMKNNPDPIPRKSDIVDIWGYCTLILAERGWTDFEDQKQ